jgi:2-polyprenyl-3-methyl-5-hydroxy-6-metoxy-1,4-benzoquinol methylase
MIGLQVVLLLFSPVLIYCQNTKLESLEGKVVLDDACGTGVLTKELISQPGDMTVQAGDFSEAMVNYMKALCRITISLYNS